MNTIGWIVLVIAVVVIIVLVIVAASWRRRATLQQRFGPEYDREVEMRGSERDAAPPARRR